MNTVYVQKPELQLIGVSTRTSNQEESGPNGVLPGLWEAYFKSGLQSNTAIENPHHIYSLYTDYENQHHGAYTVLIGHEAKQEAVTAGFDNKTAPSAVYMLFQTRKGPVHQVVPEAWGEIWHYFNDSPVKRTYTGDFELYDARQFDPNDASVQIYIAVESLPSGE